MASNILFFEAMLNQRHRCKTYGRVSQRPMVVLPTVATSLVYQRRLFYQSCREDNFVGVEEKGACHCLDVSLDRLDV